jgi:hypothetical protein
MTSCGSGRFRTCGRPASSCFPRAQVDAWLAAKGAAPVASTRARPPIIAGSHDPLLEWSARESHCGLAILAHGSRAGIDALASGDATAAAVHWLDEASGDYNVPLIREALAGADVVGAGMGAAHARACCSQLATPSESEKLPISHGRGC